MEEDGAPRVRGTDEDVHYYTEGVSDSGVPFTVVTYLIKPMTFIYINGNEICLAYSDGTVEEHYRAIEIAKGDPSDTDPDYETESETE